MKNYYLSQRLYHPTEVRDLCNEAYWNGLQAKLGIYVQSTKLVLLLERILRTAAISSPAKLQSHLLELAAQEAGEADLKNLAGEITKRYDVVTSTFAQMTGSPLSAYDQSIYNDVKTVREAVLQLDGGNNSKILSMEVLNIVDRIIHWRPHENTGRPTGMAESTKWICERLLYHRKQFPRGWWRAGLELYREIVQTPGDLWTDGHEQAHSIIKNYISNDDDKVEDKAGLRKYCSKLVERYRSIYGKY